MVNKFYDLRGGTERVMFDLRDGLVERGHEVIPFSMQDPRNEPSEWSEYFVPQRDYNRGGLATKLRQARLTIHDEEASVALDALLERAQPQLAHLHNIYHQLSPSILAPLRRRGIPVVMTLHDYKLACPSYTMYRKGGPCEICVNHRVPLACALHACSRGSRMESIVLSIESTIHRARKVYERGVDRFVCPSEFLASVMRRRGIGGDQLLVIPNAPRHSGEPLPWKARAERPRVLYAGRLSPEKGIEILLDASREIPGVDLTVAGEGPLEHELRQRAQGASWIRFTGKLDLESLRRERGLAWALAVPSQWYENAPLTVLESFAAGRGVLASDLGGLPEMVGESSGRCIAAGDTRAWRAALAALAREEELWKARGEAARRCLEERYDHRRHLDAHEALYTALLQEKA